MGTLDANTLFLLLALANRDLFPAHKTPQQILLASESCSCWLEHSHAVGLCKARQIIADHSFTCVRGRLPRTQRSEDLPQLKWGSWYGSAGSKQVFLPGYLFFPLIMSHAVHAVKYRLQKCQLSSNLGQRADVSNCESSKWILAQWGRGENLNLEKYLKCFLWERGFGCRNVCTLKKKTEDVSSAQESRLAC